MNSLDNKTFLLIDHLSPDKKVDFNTFFHFFKGNQLILFLKEFNLFQEKLRAIMSLDGESLFSIVKCVHLLLLAKVILLDLHENFASIQVGKIFFIFL